VVPIESYRHSGAIPRGPDYFQYGLLVLPVAEVATTPIGCFCLRFRYRGETDANDSNYLTSPRGTFIRA
jgi:hypothetical protein